MLSLSILSGIFFISTPLIKIESSGASYILIISLTSVLFPEPTAPANDSELPALIFRLISERILFLPVYENVRDLISISPFSLLPFVRGGWVGVEDGDWRCSPIINLLLYIHNLFNPSHGGNPPL